MRSFVRRDMGLGATRGLVALILLATGSFVAPAVLPTARRREQTPPRSPSPQRRSTANHEPPSSTYFALVAAAGAVSCSCTHSLVVPIDVVKTRLQTDAAVHGPKEAIQSLFASGHGKGAARLLPFFNGVGATAIGYFAQGMIKFGASLRRATRAPAFAPPHPTHCSHDSSLSYSLALGSLAPLTLRLRAGDVRLRGCSQAATSSSSGPR